MRALLLPVVCLFAALLFCQGNNEPLPVVVTSLPYPPAAWSNGATGSATVRIQIADNGDVTAATVVATTSNPKTVRDHGFLYASAAETNVRQWRFAPASAGNPSPRQLTVQYVFTLEGERDHCGCTKTVFHLPNRVDVTSTPPATIVDRFGSPRGSK